MRFFEFADAQAQLDLLRVIVDNTWSAIAQQAQQQKQIDDERKAQSKLTARTYGAVKRVKGQRTKPRALPLPKPLTPNVQSSAASVSSSTTTARNQPTIAQPTKVQYKQTPADSRDVQISEPDFKAKDEDAAIQ